MIKDTMSPRSHEPSTTPLNDLPDQDLRYRLAAHLDLGDDLPDPRSTPRQPTPGQNRDGTRKLPLPPGDDSDARSLTKRFPSAVSNCRRHHKDDQHPSRRFVPRRRCPWCSRLSSASQPVRRRHLSTLGDRPRSEPAQPELGRRSVGGHKIVLLCRALVTVMIMGWSRVIWLCQLLPSLPSTKRGGGWLTSSPLIRKATVFRSHARMEPTAD